jgi:hypothetical protein
MSDAPLNNAAFKELLHGSMREVGMVVFERYAEALLTTDDVEEMRKGLTFITTTLNAVEEKKQDPNANLPVFNFVFGNAGVQMTQVIENAADQAHHPNQLHELEFKIPEHLPAYLIDRVGVNQDLADDADEVLDC